MTHTREISTPAALGPTNPFNYVQSGGGVITPPPDCTFIFYGGASCGGTIIANQWILTAAHCTNHDKADSRSSVEPENVAVLIGGHDTRNVTKIHKWVSKVFSHPRYTPLGHYNHILKGLRFDATLLKLEEPLVFTKTVSPVCLPRFPELEPGTKCTITGWGLTAGGGKASDQLREAEVTLRSTGSCVKDKSGIFSKGLAPEELCLGSTVNATDKDGSSLYMPRLVYAQFDLLKRIQTFVPNSSETVCVPVTVSTKLQPGRMKFVVSLGFRCQGDSGGPSVCLNTTSPQAQWFQVGITSYRLTTCEAAPVVHMRVSHLLPWIAAVLYSEKYEGWFSNVTISEYNNVMSETLPPATTKSTTTKATRSPNPTASTSDIVKVHLKEGESKRVVSPNTTVRNMTYEISAEGGVAIQISSKRMHVGRSRYDECSNHTYLKIMDKRYPKFPMVYTCGDAPLAKRSYSNELVMTSFAESERVSFEIEFTSVLCGREYMKCPSNTSICIPPAQICDGKRDCPKGEDEFCPNTDQCGISKLAESNADYRPKISGGFKSPNNWPWLVMIRLKTGDAKELGCSGTIIGHDWILTSASCNLLDKGKDDIRVIAGTRTWDQSQFREIEKVVKHPSYTWPYNSLMPYPNSAYALLKLKKSLVFSDKIQPVCLAQLEQPPAGTECYITGWGKDSLEGTESATDVNQAPIVLRSEDLCVDDGPYTGGLSPELMCAGNGSTNICSGDDGAPLICRMTPVEKKEGQWQLVGLGLGSSVPCNSTGLYARVRSALPFIASTLYSEGQTNLYKTTPAPTTTRRTSPTRPPRTTTPPPSTWPPYTKPEWITKDPEVEVDPWATEGPWEFLLRTSTERDPWPRPDKITSPRPLPTTWKWDSALDDEATTRTRRRRLSMSAPSLHVHPYILFLLCIALVYVYH